MKIIIPMAGSGDRFIRAGYRSIKPLIEIEGKPMIEHVINMFPGEEDFIFISNREHLARTGLRTVLETAKPSGKIVPIESHKFGPVYTVLKTVDLIIDDEPVVVNYCDFSCCWNYADFKQIVAVNNYDGCVTAYKGFHPHLLGDGLYAGMRSDSRNMMLEIKEKHSFTENKMDSYHSAGTYYFRRGSYIKKYFRELIEKDINIKGEYYASIPFQLMKEDGLRIYIYELEHFLQWGTPEDMEEYIYWSEYFRECRERRA